MTKKDINPAYFKTLLQKLVTETESLIAPVN